MIEEIKKDYDGKMSVAGYNLRGLKILTPLNQVLELFFLNLPTSVILNMCYCVSLYLMF